MHKMPSGFYTLLCAQFFSSWADNALLIVAIAHLMLQGESAWMIPLLKFGFTLAYVIWAPWVGSTADGWNKSTIMWASHAIKLLGVFGMVAGWNTVLCYAIVGVGAALYSPAKYGWMSQMVPPDRLVKANGWIETSSVCAAVGGVACAGWWISVQYRQLYQSAAPWMSEWADGLWPAYLSVAVFYLLTVCMTWTVPSAPLQHVNHMQWWKRPVLFLTQDWLKLWRDAQARVSLCITTLFWGVGACMQLLVLEWAQWGLDLTLEQGAYLQGVSGLGVIVGAWLAARCITLQNHHKVLSCGVALGCLLPLMLGIQDWRWAVPVLMLLGALAGLLVVPMNAMLQHRGLQVLTSGRSVAVQNFNENLSILGMLGIYSAVLHWFGSWIILLLLLASVMVLISVILMCRCPAQARALDPFSNDLLAASQPSIDNSSERS